jgi:hypothetical protein
MVVQNLLVHVLQFFFVWQDQRNSSHVALESEVNEE